MNWHEILNEVLAHNKITEYRLCRIIGVSNSYFANIRNGRNVAPSFSYAIELLKLHPDTWLIENGKFYRNGVEI